ncbi:hypothetical protein [Verrucomicrobium spinosum]|uniref:hypothetical protein n=1 Tax=Verrucomicrobium spinosum TaxID=2736 RepID=UPI0012E0CBA9|nr:hypothetical protein [Verrucomicrobium spinosum]
MQHFLKLYQMRLSMAERGVTSPHPDIVTAMRQLTTSLSAQDPDAKVRLEIHGSRTRFIATATGELLGEFHHTDDA